MVAKIGNISFSQNKNLHSEKNVVKTDNPLVYNTQEQSTVPNYKSNDRDASIEAFKQWLCASGTTIGTISTTYLTKKNTSQKAINIVLEQLDDVMKIQDFSSYGKNGLPLTYPRAEFIDDIGKVLKKIPKNSQSDFLSKFNLKLGNMDIDGIPNIKGFNPITEPEIEMVELIKRFYNNSTTISDLKTKNTIDNLLKICPEFTMVIGKPQHGTHVYSVDVHSLELLKRAMNSETYKSLSQEGKNILKYSALLHDFGKKGNVITTGHAATSKIYAEGVLANYPDMPQNVKNRILNLIENHHWFEGYNKGNLSVADIARIFPNDEDKKIAILLAKGDFESVNPTFHLNKLVFGESLSEKEYEAKFADIMKNLFDKLTKVS